jgi:hypothetical protein
MHHPKLTRLVIRQIVLVGDLWVNRFEIVGTQVSALHLAFSSLLA